MCLGSASETHTSEGVLPRSQSMLPFLPQDSSSSVLTCSPVCLFTDNPPPSQGGSFMGLEWVPGLQTAHSWHLALCLLLYSANTKAT